MKERGWTKVAALATGLGCAMLSASGCADDPFDFGGPRSCEVVDQNEWVLGLMEQAYLFADDLEPVDPTAYDDPHAMVVDLRVSPDRWSRVSDKARSDALFQEGKTVSLGFRTRRDADDRVVVADVNADSPASAAGMRRGDVIRTIDGKTTETIDSENLWGGIYGESMPGVTVDLEVQSPGEVARAVSLTKDWIAIETVPIHEVYEVDGRPVGYLMFATFVDTAPAALDNAFAAFRREGVRDVVIDLRYNGGGLVKVARHFMHLLVGGVAEGRIAYRVQYNDQFSDESSEHTLLKLEHSLPAVDNIVFITTGSSLSASELLINAVRPHAPTTIVGGTTGGKPVGSRHFPFCDKIAVPLTFQLVNAEAYGGYFDGLPADCDAPDDFSHQLGEVDEASLATALHYVSTGTCLDHGEAASASMPLGLRTPAAPAAPLSPFEFPELTGLR